MKERNTRKIKTQMMLTIAMLSAISYILAFMEISVPFSPSFAKMDMSDLPALIATFAFTPVAGVANYFILLPLYEKFMPLEQIIASFSKLIPFINGKLDIVIWNVIPFNLLKGIGISVTAILLYKPLTPILKR